PLLGVQRSVHHLVAKHTIATDRADDRDVRASLARHVVADALAAQRPAVLSRELNVAARLVEEDDVVPVDALHQLEERVPRLLDFGSELLPRTETLFFRVIPARRSALDIAERLTTFPVATSHRS